MKETILLAAVITSQEGCSLAKERQTLCPNSIPDELTYYNKILYSKDYKGSFLCCENGIGFLSDKGSLTMLTSDDFSSSVKDVIIDYQGNVWFASSTQGIKKYSWNPFEDIFARSNVSGTVVNSVLVKDGLLYAGTGTGLVTIDLKTYYSVPIPHPELFRSVKIKHIMRDSGNNLWFSTYGKAGLIKMLPDKSVVTFDRIQGDAVEGDVFNPTLTNFLTGRYWLLPIQVLPLSRMILL